ncbi:MAG: hypothetical protein ACI9QL_000525 [Candidatus Omnitrophota bacterium]|jgi:hypothetical protein
MNALQRILMLLFLGLSMPVSAALEWVEHAVRPTMTFSTTPATCKVFKVSGTIDPSGTDTISVPFPDGSLHRFAIAASNLMHPDLAAVFPELQTWSGVGLDEPACTLQMDRSPRGYHLQILTPETSIYIDPCLPGDPSMLVVHDRRDARAADGWICTVPVQALRARLQRQRATFTNGDVKRTYRLAVAATGEYTQFHGGTVGDGMAAIVTTINRVRGIYERELAISFQLVANNQLLVYTNASTDPYTNNDGDSLVDENQANIDSVIGDANYDLGHVFGTGGGGLADPGLCISGLKASGQTGSSNPIGDFFDVDFVAHEIGHQLGANHSFNGVISDCAGNRYAPTAYAPGSGSTIMGYAGLCGGDNLQFASDDYFHSANLEEILNYLASNPDCAVTNATGNQIPVVSAGPDVVIPASTPFTLTASASDPDGSPVFVAWEQMDLGPAASLNAPDDGFIPLFRSFAPSTDASRTFPRLAELLNNTTPKGETLPTAQRTLTFQVSARDWVAGGGAVATDEMSVTVDASAGPFLVTAPNSAVSWSNQETVTWDVANTDGGQVLVATVNIRLSLDGGQTFPIVLQAGTPNDGVALVQLPSVATSQARIKVAAANGVFFDVSNTDFTLLPYEFVQVDPTSVRVFTGPAGGAFSPGCFTYTVSNATSRTIDWQMFSDEAFLDVTPSFGTLPADQSVSIQVCTNPAVNGLGVGLHTALLTVTNTTDGAAIQREVLIDAQAPGGSIAMDAAVIQVDEAVGSVMLGLHRTGYSNRAVGVTYATTPNTAGAGDYLASTGLVTWAIGESGMKTISMGVTDDALVEGQENFRVTLSNPSNGAALGVPIQTKVVISDNDSPTVNDGCVDAVLISSMPFSTTQSTVGFTSTGDPIPACTEAPARGGWYRYSPLTVGHLRVDTLGSDFDTVLVLYEGSCGALTEWVCGDDLGALPASSLGSVVYPGHTYYILAGGYDQDAGSLVVNMSFQAEASTCVNLLQDGDFEEGQPYPGWPVNSSDNFGVIICDGTCGAQGIAVGPRSGANWAWYTGPDGTTETGNVGQVVFIPEGDAMLSFQLWVGAVAAPFTDVFRVLIDEVPVTTIVEPSVASPGYQAYAVDVSAFADGQPHALVFRLEGQGGGDANFSLDDINLEVCIPDLDADGIPNTWETRFGLVVTNAADARVDGDLDGLSNLEEYIADTDPNDANDFLQLLIQEARGSVAELRFRSALDRVYALEYRTGFGTDSWANIRSNFPGTGSPLILRDTNAVHRRLYRLGVELGP